MRALRSLATCVALIVAVPTLWVICLPGYLLAAPARKAHPLPGDELSLWNRLARLASR